MDRLVGVVQNYAWGHEHSIADIVGHASSGEPEAEYWMGAHPKAPGTLSDGVSLLDAIEADRVGWLGPAADRFEGLPYLFKILAAAQPLSIQAHPSLEQAIAGFVQENERGPAIDAADRTYRDPNHKPEMVCALTQFEALCGFRPEESLRAVVEGIEGCDDALEPLLRHMAGPGAWSARLQTIVTWLLGAGNDPERDALVSALSSNPGTSGEPASRAIEIAALAAGFYPGDPGIAVSLLLNPLTLAPGDAVFLRAGNVHAYLSGTAIELMANSDNVVRCGLTPKHVDVDELLSVARFEGIDPPIQTAADSGLHRFATPVQEFSLVRVSLDPALAPDGIEVSSEERLGPDLVLVVAGSVQILADDGDELLLTKGQVAAIPHGAGGYVMAGQGELFIAEVGLP